METSRVSRLVRRVLARWYHLRGIGHRYWGNRLVSSAQYRWAIIHFDQALTLDPTFTQARYDRALVLWRELGQPEQAVRDLTHVLEVEPERSEALFNRAMARQMLGNVTGALSDFEAYLKTGEDEMWRDISRRQMDILRSSKLAEEGKDE